MKGQIFRTFVVILLISISLLALSCGNKSNQSSHPSNQTSNLPKETVPVKPEALTLLSNENNISETMPVNARNDVQSLLSIARGKKANVYEIKINTGIFYPLDRFVKRSVESAIKNKASAVIFSITTNGGEISIMQNIISEIEKLAPIPTIAYIDTKAYSAGAIIAAACDEIYMAEGSSVGSTTAIIERGDTIVPLDAVSEKMDAASRAYDRAIAEKHGHSPKIMMAMYDKDVELYQVYVNGKKKYCIRMNINNCLIRPIKIHQ